jgi:hypothetical protein
MTADKVFWGLNGSVAGALVAIMIPRLDQVPMNCYTHYAEVGWVPEAASNYPAEWESRGWVSGASRDIPADWEWEANGWRCRAITPSDGDGD